MWVDDLVAYLEVADVLNVLEDSLYSGLV